MRPSRTSQRFAWTLVALMLCYLAASVSLAPGAAAQTVGPAAAALLVPADQNDPNGFYGNCRIPLSGLVRKSGHVTEVGKNLAEVRAIVVLECRAFDGPGGTQLIEPCVPYDYCLLNENDGTGNHVRLGVKVDRELPKCNIVARRRGQVAQIDIRVQDVGTGIRSIGFTGPQTNMETQQYFADSRSPVIVTVTKIDQSQRSVFGLDVTDGAGNLVTCSFSF